MKSGFFITVGVILIITGLMLNYIRIQGSSQMQPPKLPPITVTPSTISCNGKPTAAETEGPYYKAGSPERSDLTSPAIPGKKLTLTGYVLNTSCHPIAHAELDFWQADGNGHYDNAGYTLRGHQYTNAQGRYTLVTVIPGEYPGRTPHIHVKVRATDTSPTLTTQLYLPGLATNTKDAIYDPTLQMQKVEVINTGTTATFNFILAK